MPGEPSWIDVDGVSECEGQFRVSSLIMLYISTNILTSFRYIYNLCEVKLNYRNQYCVA